jgi:Ca-activated chloride channel family protein
MDLMRALRIVALTSALFCSAAQAGDVWDSLWRNADQRGEQLLQQGDAAAAARTFSEPRRKAYAELQAGDVAAAASDFAAFDDSDGHYNRGNALARGGELKQALQAYDAALAHDPKNHDAQHNRDLVAKALRDQQQQQQQSKKDQSDQQPSQSDQASKDSSPAGSADKPAPPPPSSASKPHASELRPPGDSHSSTEKPPDDPSAEQQAGGADQSKSVAPRAAAAKDDVNDQAKDEAEQVQRDAQDALQRRSRGVDDHAIAQQAPMTEQQLAEEQWLRQIPDDPGGLLRRKFMIEHLLRQGQQPEPFNTR